MFPAYPVRLKDGVKSRKGTEVLVCVIRHQSLHETATVPDFLSSYKDNTTNSEGPPTQMRTILLLSISNLFMTFAWYGHLKYRSEALWKVVLASWSIAFFEYCFQVPANRIGSYEFNPAQLKTIQEIITLSIFPVFSVFYLGDKFKWNFGVGFALIVAAAFFIFHKW